MYNKPLFSRSAELFARRRETSRCEDLRPVRDTPVCACVQDDVDVPEGGVFEFLVRNPRSPFGVLSRKTHGALFKNTIINTTKMPENLTKSCSTSSPDFTVIVETPIAYVCSFDFYYRLKILIGHSSWNRKIVNLTSVYYRITPVTSVLCQNFNFCFWSNMIIYM